MIAARLSVMMYLQFFLWGAWYVTAPSALTPLGFAPADFGWTYSVGPIAGMISPFFVGMFADRFFATERVLGLLHLLGAGAMFAAVTQMSGEKPNPDVINGLFFVHMLCYYPTLALTNSLAMQNMTNPEKQFPLIRVFGTLGWIAAGIALTKLDWASSTMMFKLAGAAGVVLGVFSLIGLPHTPPPSKGKAFRLSDALGLEAFVLLKRPSYFVFMLSSFLICIPLAFYYQMAARAVEAGGVVDPALKMTFGQMSEVGFMIVMPVFFARLGVKWMLAVGMLAWVVRYALFALGTPDHVTWMLLGGVLLHGICYDFFFVTGQIYTDKVAPPAIRNQAQGMLVLFTLGFGMLIGAQVAGRVETKFTPPETAQLSEQAGAISKRLEAGAKSLTDAEKTTLKAEAADKSLKALQAKDWKSIWAIPAAGALVILLLFVLVFRDDSKSAGSPEPAPAG